MRYLELELYNMAPLRFGDDDTSQQGQANTLLHIPGSTVRGLVIHELCGEGQEFENIKKLLFSDKIRFMNAYVKKAGKTMIPSLKGFYEDKKACEGKKEIENVVVKGDVTPGTKRASLGRCCYPEGDCVLCGDVATGENLNINRGREGEKTVFRSQYIRQGQSFTGYITFDDSVEEEVIRKIQGIFSDVIYMGNNRYGGYGACRLVKAERKEGIPYGELRTKADRNQFYMVLLSHMAMRNRWGQPAGLDLDILAEKLGCGSLELVRCATSVTEVLGYNRSWRGPVPSLVMYEAGSVFCLKTGDGEMISGEKFAAVEEEGLGIRRNEGFGQVLFFDGYEKLRYRQAIKREDAAAAGETEPESDGRSAAKNMTAYGILPVSCESEPGDMRIAAKGLLTRRLEKAIERYVVDNPLRLPGISSSKMGVVQSLCQELKYVPAEAKKCLEDYISHWEKNDERRKDQGPRARQAALHRYVRMMLDRDLMEILDIPEDKRQALGLKITQVLSGEELWRYKLQLMIRQIRYANREVRENEN